MVEALKIWFRRIAAFLVLNYHKVWSDLIKFIFVIDRPIFILLGKTVDIEMMKCCAQNHIDNLEGVVELRGQMSNLLKMYELKGFNMLYNINIDVMRYHIKESYVYLKGVVRPKGYISKISHECDCKIVLLHI